MHGRELTKNPDIWAVAIVWLTMASGVGAALLSEAYLGAPVYGDGLAPGYFAETSGAQARFASADVKERPAACLPLSSLCDRVNMAIQGRAETAEASELTVDVNMVDSRLFKALRVPLIFGRTFTPADGVESTPVAVINDAAARRFFPNDDPIGQRIRLSLDSHDCGWTEIIGVVSDVSFGEPALEIAPTVYVSHQQFGDHLNSVVVQADTRDASASLGV